VNRTITAIPGVAVGHWTNVEARTGCTVVVLPEPNVVAGEARGAAPGTREYALLQPGMRVEQAQAFLLTGGSAFGLAAADGVVQGLHEDGRGHDTGLVRVPIVPAAVVFDLFPGDASVRPGPAEGLAAYRSASSDPVETGLVGVGTGTTVAKWRGFEHMKPGGLGSAVHVVGDSRVGALVAVNAIGDVFTLEGDSLTGGSHEPGPLQLEAPPTSNTILAVLATDSRLDRIQLSRLMVRAHDAFGACVRPVHTRFDGDVVFAASVGDADGDVDALGEAAFVATARAIENAITSSGLA
jgi:L-aminopeptidase/D-esterase-like protein